LVARYARTHGPFTAVDVAGRFACPVERIAGALAALEADDRIVRGEFRPNGVGREFCDADVLRQLRRRSLATLRREIEPVEPAAYARFVQAWHGIPGERRGLDALVEALGQLQGAALVASTLESELLPARLRTYRAADLDELCTTGDVVWVGAGALGPSDGRIRLYFADQFRALDAALDGVEPPSGPLHQAIRTHLATHGASFWNQLRGASSDASDAETQYSASDASEPGRALGASPRHVNSLDSRSPQKGQGMRISMSKGNRPVQCRLGVAPCPFSSIAWPVAKRSSRNAAASGCVSSRASKCAKHQPDAGVALNPP